MSRAAFRVGRTIAFRMDPETAHAVALCAVRSGAPLLVPGTRWRTRRVPSVTQDLMGLRFDGPVGLAAGYDKYARAVRAWGRLGFGFAEIGTVTAHAQPGNPRPRLFRLPDDEAIVNRMGFNNDGAEITARRIAGARRGRGAGIPIAVNIGKSKVTPLADAAADHVASFRILRGVADLVVVNVSSPNTPGLRELQDRDHLMSILGALRDEDAAMCRRDGCAAMPLLVKLAPDLPDAQIEDAVDLAGELGLAGVVLTNTTVSREGLRNPGAPGASEQGGLSGPPLRRRADEAVRIAARRAAGDLVIVGVGGIMDSDDAWDRIASGAALVEVWTGLVYRGPLVARDITAGLIRRMAAEGVGHISELRGTALGATG
ncbi:MAG: quinone-dependent dihydroorotate dehydrogenase [Thermoleophilia bacterium]|nr:quinone-dependent dihydroorotate dehydrogenase [Thermoleophilia bacterium]